MKILKHLLIFLVLVVLMGVGSADVSIIPPIDFIGTDTDVTFDYTATYRTFNFDFVTDTFYINNVVIDFNSTGSSTILMSGAFDYQVTGSNVTITATGMQRGYYTVYEDSNVIGQYEDDYLIINAIAGKRYVVTGITTDIPLTTPEETISTVETIFYVCVTLLSLLSLVAVAVTVNSVLQGNTPSVSIVMMALGTLIAIVIMLIIVVPFLDIAEALI